MKTIKGPGIFLAQFLDNQPPYNNLDNICKWIASLGYKGVQIPTWDSRCIDLKLAAESKMYCEDILGIVQKNGLEISELSTHLQGQLIAVNPAYNDLFDGFAPVEIRNNPKERQIWATNQLIYAAKASANMGLKAHGTFSGSLLWHTIYPWPQRPSGLIEDSFTELAKRWLPILNTFDELGINLCYEIHPGEDLHDGISYEMFLEKTGNHPRACILYDPSHLILQCMDYIGYIDCYHEKIKMFHVKDAEFNPTAKQGVYGGFQPWLKRAGRFRSLGDGQINFNQIFSKLAEYDFDGWAVLEWECCLKSPETGASEGAPFIQNKIIQTTNKAFDDFASVEKDNQLNKKILGI